MLCCTCLVCLVKCHLFVSCVFLCVCVCDGVLFYVVLCCAVLCASPVCPSEHSSLDRRRNGCGLLKEREAEEQADDEGDHRLQQSEPCAE